MPSQSVERSNPKEALIMLILLFIGFGLLAWVVRHEAETHPYPKQSISKPVNK